MHINTECAKVQTSKQFFSYIVVKLNGNSLPYVNKYMFLLKNNRKSGKFKIFDKISKLIFKIIPNVKYIKLYIFFIIKYVEIVNFNIIISQKCNSALVFKTFSKYK
jgi:hypothetical protein